MLPCPTPKEIACAAGASCLSIRPASRRCVSGRGLDITAGAGWRHLSVYRRRHSCSAAIPGLYYVLAEVYFECRVADLPMYALVKIDTQIQDKESVLSDGRGAGTPGASLHNKATETAEYEAGRTSIRSKLSTRNPDHELFKAPKLSAGLHGTCLSDALKSGS